MEFLSWQPTKIVKLNNFNALKFSYTRSVNARLPVLVNEIVAVYRRPSSYHHRNDVLAEVMRAARPRVPVEVVEKYARLEHVYAHRRQAMGAVVVHRLGMFGLLLEAPDAVVAVYGHDAVMARHRNGHLGRRNCQVRALGIMEIDHLAVIHLVDVIARKDQDMVWLFILDRVDILIERISRALIPAIIETLLRGYYVYILAQFSVQHIPAAGYVPGERVGFVLSQDVDSLQP